MKLVHTSQMPVLHNVTDSQATEMFVLVRSNARQGAKEGCQRPVARCVPVCAPTTADCRAMKSLDQQHQGHAHKASPLHKQTPPRPVREKATLELLPSPLLSPTPP